MFIPDRRIIRLMIGAIMSKPEHTSDERFMLRFGIIDYETNFYDRE
jgi:hypothetical protein